ncbi:activating signal cointegrator 1 complex subunit 2 [Hyalella azteca]|uniref:Activating signal cointegrator 1 complex subunit 2 n=1 Tax=Hyalella azteca TaxID=294128 RepID=A0A8B7NPP4_HYAAZ|nr:activating signal cointegrator 1 complex subunit 2 [Hyalella azteca]
MSSTGAIPRVKKIPNSSLTSLKSPPGFPTTLPHDVQILVGQEASEPLDIKLLTISSNGVQTKIPALSKSWCELRELMKYSPPPQHGLELPGALDAWLEQIEFFRQDLEWMLALPHHKFWSELIYSRKIHKCLVSYLSQAPRWYDEGYLNIMNDIQHRNIIGPVLLSVHKLVFLVHLRMSTYKESKSNHISASAFGDLLYDHYVLDVCQLLDLCSLYHPSDSALLSKAISNVFTHQPKYKADLRQLLESVISALDNVEEQLAVSDGGAPMSLKHTSSSSHSAEELHAVLMYLLDTFYSLHNFLCVYPQSATIFHECEMHIRTCLCYERVIPCLSHNSSARRADSPADEDSDSGFSSTAATLLRLEQLRSTMLLTFRAIIKNVCIDPISDASGAASNECFEKYHHIVSSCLAEKHFIADYHTSFNFFKDIELYKKHNIDTTAVHFLEDAVKGILSDMNITESVNDGTLANGNNATVHPKCKLEDNSGMTQYVATGSTEVDAVHLAELVSSVQDLMPHLGAGYIAACLKHYRYSSEELINALLEGTLPPELLSLDPSLSTAPQSMQLTEQSKPSSSDMPVAAAPGYHSTYEQGEDAAKLSVLNRANIYNDDEFDVFGAGRVDTTKVHRGKKKKDALETDDDVRERVRALGRMYDERQGRSIYEDEDPENSLVPIADYNDEYDDTYDDNEAGNMDANTEIAMPIRKRAMNRPPLFNRGALNAPLQADSNSENDEDCSTGGASLEQSVALPAEEDELEFERRRGLRKGLGGAQFIAELREYGGVINRKPLVRDRNLPASHDFHNNRPRHQRFLPRDFHRDHHKPVRNDCNEENASEPQGVSADEDDFIEAPTGSGAPEPAENDLSFVPFCENPEVLRQRMAQRKASQDLARNRRGNRGQRDHGPMPPPQPILSNGFYGGSEGLTSGGLAPPAAPVVNGTSDSAGARGGARPKTYTNKSGKSWRHGTDDEARGSRGGKWKEDTNHGKAQDPNFRRKMEQKNKARKQAAQNKFERNN